MSEQDETYCRLCAEPTPTDQLISSDGDVGKNSKICTKMLWINIDMNSPLPNAICFSCFDMLERTWQFLHNVRTAQQKLNEIFAKKSEDATATSTKTDSTLDTGKPVNKDWEEFQDTKLEVKDESPIDNLQIITVDPNSLMDVDLNIIKTERDSDDDVEVLGDGFDSTDSDIPLQLSVKKKKLKKTKKSSEKLANQEIDEVTLSWDNYMCRCANCDAQCKNMSLLRLHSLHIHSCCCVFKCSDCGKAIGSFRNFINHVRVHNKVLRYYCEFCNKRFTRSAYTKKHRNTVHRDAYLTMCGNCGASFDTHEQLKDHILIYSKSLKKRTLKRENGETDLRCNHCNKEFKSRSNLVQHKLVHTERRRDFSCHVCGKMFYTKGTLGTHMMTHEDTKPYKCEFCPMAFRARGNLQSHVSLHSAAKPFVCEQCGKSFRVKRHLKSHSIVHTDLMPYECEYCHKAFRFKTRLNLHLRQHTGAKPYTCIYCQRDFTNGSNFKKHMKRRHNIDTSKKKYNNIVNEKSLDGSDEVNSNQT
ncbi:gastrula zinc finger protein XlCGF26.1-like [Galleria mellonella]|uniref:Gastrula zinc finger protein XlCGF26.1-like n=1 Tax=Galleria mellonella TaxID=7137 RepID=A0ABM3MSY5_GALME|nr:gastrula zinc finger protein XlCGF26.1-like [Galleria mellonella]